MIYDGTRHALVREIAHLERLTPEEDDLLCERLAEADISIFYGVEIPEYPPVEYPPLVLMMGGSDPWTGRYITGRQRAISVWDSNKATYIAREMAGDPQSPKRMAYAWHLPVYDPARHILTRDYIDSHRADYPDFLNVYIPKMERELGRKIILDVTPPLAAEKRDQFNQWTPMRRAVAIEDAGLLAAFVAESGQPAYDRRLAVGWTRSADGSFWEVRCQNGPQANWFDYRSWVMRALGSGPSTEADAEPGTGYRRGPLMQLFDDGALYVWVVRHAAEEIAGKDIYVNEAAVRLALETPGIAISRMAGHVPADRMEDVLDGAVRPEPLQLTSSGEIPEPLALIVSAWENNTPFYRPALPPDSKLLYRARGHPLIYRARQSGAEIRMWGDPAIGLVPITLNGVTLKIRPWRDGYRAVVSAADAARILTGRISPVPDVQDTQDVQDVPAVPDAPAVLPPPPPPRPAPEPEVADAITRGAVVYSAESAVAALRAILGPSMRLFSKTTTDTAIVALTREGLNLFLSADRTDRLQYIRDAGSRNFDCENFSELFRSNLQKQYGINGVAVVAGDGHAWTAVIVAGPDGPQVVMLEPQDDRVVTELTGMYSVKMRCEVLL